MFEGLLFLLINFFSVAALSLLLIRKYFCESEQYPEFKIVTFVVLCCLQVVFMTLLLGYLSLFEPIFIQLFSLLPFGLVLLHEGIGRSSWKSVMKQFPIARLRGFHAEAYGLGTLLMLWAIAGVLSEPVDFDSNGYRLSRIGLWFQEGSIFQGPTSDPRMNYMAINGDLIMAWIMAPFSEGYPLFNGVQLVGAVLIMVSLSGLAKIMKFRRFTRATLLCSLFGIPMYCGQLMTEQIDLFLAGLVSAVLFLGVKLVLEKRVCPIFWATFAIALGAKGSLFYWGPGLVLLAIGIQLRFRFDMRFLSKHLWVGCLFVLVFSSPRYVENYYEFGNPFAPEEQIARLHGSEESSVRSFFERFLINAKSYFIETATVGSNPLLSESLLQVVAMPLIETLPEGMDAHTLSAERKLYLSKAARGEVPQVASLMTSWGLPFSLFVFSGLWVFMFHRRRSGWADSDWIFLFVILSIVVWFLFFAGQYRWSPYKFRFIFVFIIPALILIGMLFERLPRLFETAVAGSWMFFSLASSLHIFLFGHATGIESIKNVENFDVFKVKAFHRLLIDDFARPGDRIAVSLPYYASLSGFFRNGSGVETDLVRAADVLSYKNASEFLKKTNRKMLFFIEDSIEAGEQVRLIEVSAEIPERHRFDLFVLESASE